MLRRVICSRASAGRTGERYILGGENLTLCRIFEKLEGISGLKAPKVRIPYAVAYAAGVVTTAWAELIGQRASGSAGRGKDGPQEDVGHARQGD